MTEPQEPPATLQDTVLRLAEEAGFAHAGIAPAGDLAESAYLEEWVERGHAGEMEYLKRRDAEGELVRSSLRSVAPWARSVVVCAAPYQAAAPRSIDPSPAGSGWIARYAWSGTPDASGQLRPADYHKVLLARLRQLEAALQARLGSFTSWAYVDTGPLIERAWAERAGVGWTAKNTCTIRRDLGSFFFLGVILTSLEVPGEALAAIAPDRCGSCTRCIDACPTQALVEPYRMDASRCISYLTIEKRGAIPTELREGMGRQVFGCDICQDVCPWNRKAPIAADPSMQPRAELINPSLAWLAALSEAEYAGLFHGSPVKRAKIAGLRRNVAIAMGNSGDPGFAEQLQAWAREDDAVVAEAAVWALAQLETHRSVTG
ncbi:MAG TPA: tRNA epoxyqueuosine(34) reductase QueG [Acidobacteriaceae bacterium]